MTDLDTLPVVCSGCGHDRAVYLGREGAYRLFQCTRCEDVYSLQEREERGGNVTKETWQQVRDALHASAPSAHIRDHGIEAWFTLRTVDRDFMLGWLVDPDNGRIRRLLDYDGWIYCDMTPAAILDAVEDSERERTRLTWPNHPQWQVTEVIREVQS